MRIRYPRKKIEKYRYHKKNFGHISNVSSVIAEFREISIIDVRFFKDRIRTQYYYLKIMVGYPFLQQSRSTAEKVWYIFQFSFLFVNNSLLSFAEQSKTGNV